MTNAIRASFFLFTLRPTLPNRAGWVWEGVLQSWGSFRGSHAWTGCESSGITVVKQWVPLPTALGERGGGAGAARARRRLALAAGARVRAAAPHAPVHPGLARAALRRRGRAPPGQDAGKTFHSS